MDIKEASTERAIGFICESPNGSGGSKGNDLKETAHVTAKDFNINTIIKVISYTRTGAIQVVRSVKQNTNYNYTHGTPTTNMTVITAYLTLVII